MLPRLAFSYDYVGAMEWFGEKSDQIVVMMDALKPEISDELKTVVESLKRYAHKMRFIINKADEITSDEELMKVMLKAKYIYIYIYKRGYNRCHQSKICFLAAF